MRKHIRLGTRGSELAVTQSSWVAEQIKKKTGVQVELVIIVTPSIINDQQGGTYGYGYRPGTSDARQLMQSGG